MVRLTCLACQVAFTDAELHRSHFKGDWHRYNLKRKVANLPFVTANEFEVRKDAHEAQTKIDEGNVKKSGTYCIACRKSFSNQKAYDNHLQSKKHKDMLLSIGEEELNNIKNKVKSAVQKVEAQVVDDVDNDDDMEVEEVDSDEWDDEAEVIPITDCLFCSNHSANIDNNIRHMSEKHSFFLPDPEYIVDLVGLMEYLGAKVGQGHVCLWCDAKSKEYQSVQAVQKHMVDKGHTKLKHEGDTLIEYADYYDYSTSYPEAEDGEADSQSKDSEADLDTLDDSGLQLKLPSGAVVGHRSLVRYYRQSLNPNRELVLAASSKPSGNVLSTYRAMGWTGSNRVEVVKKVRDIKFMNRLRNKSHMQLGAKANKLQTYFRDRNGMC